MNSETHSVLVVTKDKKTSTLINTILIKPLFDVKITGDFNEAKHLCLERIYNIIIVDWAEGQGTDFATDNYELSSTIILMAPAHLYEEISYHVEAYGIITINSPFDAMTLYNIIKVAIAAQHKVQLFSFKVTKLRDKMEEIKLINRAKMILMQSKNMTEPEAHRYIEKEAMDNCIKKTEVAKSVISLLG